MSQQDENGNEKEILFNHALDCVDQVFGKADGDRSAILPRFVRLGEDKFKAVVRLGETLVLWRWMAELGCNVYRAAVPIHEAAKWFVSDVDGEVIGAGATPEDAIRDARKLIGGKDGAS